MKKLLLLLPLFLLASVLSAQSEQAQKASLADQTRVYPNPAKSTEQVTVAFAQPLAVRLIQLIKIDGWEPGGWLQPQQDQQKVTLPLPKMSSGAHVFKIYLTDGRVVTKEIIIFK